MNSTVTFGKHRGQPLQALIDDGEYYNWLRRQGFWHDKWESKVLEAVMTGGDIPPPPAIRPMLEPVYDLSCERPARVRNITHCQTTPQNVAILCPNCGCNDWTIVRSSTTLICQLCAQHINIFTDTSLVTGGAASWCSMPVSCPSWDGKTDDDYEQACRACPDRKGMYADHTRCGCLRAFECQCITTTTT